MYVGAFPDGPTHRISRSGGREPHWRGDGSELFFLAPIDRFMPSISRTGLSMSFLRRCFALRPDAAARDRCSTSRVTVSDLSPSSGKTWRARTASILVFELAQLDSPLKPLRHRQDPCEALAAAPVKSAASLLLTFLNCMRRPLDTTTSPATGAVPERASEGIQPLAVQRFAYTAGTTVASILAGRVSTDAEPL